MPSQLRVRLLAYTGLPPGVLAKLEARNADFRTGSLHLPDRLRDTAWKPTSTRSQALGSR
jgi:hypothetical protein